MIRNVAVPVLDEVFAVRARGPLRGVRRRPPDEPRCPSFDFALCTPTPGPGPHRLRVRPAGRARPGPARRAADLVAAAGDPPRRRGARRAGRGTAGGGRPRCPGDERVQRRVRPRRRRPARRPRLHHALDLRGRAGGALPAGPGRPRRALRRLRRRADQRRAPRPASTPASTSIRKEFGERVANRLARRMVMPPHREGGQRQYVDKPVPRRGRHPDRHPGLDARQPRRGGRGRRPRPPRAPLAAHLRPAVPRRDRHHAAPLADRSAGARGAAAARGDRPARRGGRRQVGFGSASVLRHHFSRRVGTTPNDYRRTFCGRREARSA